MHLQDLPLWIFGGIGLAVAFWPKKIDFRIGSFGTRDPKQWHGRLIFGFAGALFIFFAIFKDTIVALHKN